jgi:tetratricopeptide (TPR) repeat protein
MRVLEGTEVPDPTDMHLQIASALAELGRVEEVREELATLLEGSLEVIPDGGDDLVVDLEGEPTEEVTPGLPTSPEKETEEGEAEKKAKVKKVKVKKVKVKKAKGPKIPYLPSYPEPREPTEEDRAKALHILGRVSWVAGDVPAAVEGLKESASRVPDLPGLQLDLGNALREAGDVKGALEAYQLAEDHDLDDESPRALAGICHLMLGDPKAAERAFDSAIGISPEYALAWLGKGRALMARGKHKRAVRYIREALRIDHGLTEARLSLAEAYLELGMTKEAGREVARAYALDPEAGEARKMLEAIGAKPPGHPEVAPVARSETRTQLKTEPPPPDVRPEGLTEGTGQDEELEEIPPPGPSLDKWFEEHRELPPLEKDEERS